ncbi:MAG: hypothetical protein GWO02_01665 [Gammaproteobacteria bacterium]|nr:hypothetical protein [Gammaproteobacteria bacterium]
MAKRTREHVIEGTEGPITLRRTGRGLPKALAEVDRAERRTRQAFDAIERRERTQRRAKRKSKRKRLKLQSRRAMRDCARYHGAAARTSRRRP